MTRLLAREILLTGVASRFTESAVVGGQRKHSRSCLLSSGYSVHWLEYGSSTVREAKLGRMQRKAVHKFERTRMLTSELAILAADGIDALASRRMPPLL